jgi:hypothetical protein
VDRATAICQCGWLWDSVGGLGVLEAYDAHLDVMGEWCDFCSGLWPIVREYACPTFEIDFGSVSKEGTKEIFVYHGEWLACATCSQMIEEGRWFELAIRSVEGTLLADSESGTRARPVLLALYKESPEYQASLARIAYLHQTFQRVRTQ